jgi:uncharacterized protein with HEPN domain
MTTRDWRVRIDDILEAIDKIERYTAGLTNHDTFAADEKTADAVLRNFEIIGEAAGHVPSAVQARYPAVPWAKMRGMRNVVLHGYQDVDLEIVWDTLRNDLPPLVPQLREILERES